MTDRSGRRMHPVAPQVVRPMGRPPRPRRFTRPLPPSNRDASSSTLATTLPPASTHDSVVNLETKGKGDGTSSNPSEWSTIDVRSSASNSTPQTPLSAGDNKDSWSAPESSVRQTSTAQHERPAALLSIVGPGPPEPSAKIMAAPSLTLPLPCRPAAPRIQPPRPKPIGETDAEPPRTAVTDANIQIAKPPTVSMRYPHESMPASQSQNASLTWTIGSADFFPWKGNHVEDNLTEGVVKAGFIRQSIVQNDASSARNSFSPLLKSKGGLPALSALFVSILEKRQTQRRLAAQSTFKPPPRVTANEKKREGWFKDLANPAVPLRRLTKAIPHGVKGKLLLELCLTNRVPPPRAAWLAKCVGTNEMRAFKRKGAGGSATLGGEQKWIREWTSQVEQFVDGTIANCPQVDWKDKMQYAIRLSSHLYSERLLDLDHFLDWILVGLDSSREKLPIWLVMVEIYWSHLICTRKRGRTLGEGLLEQLRKIWMEESDSVLKPLADRLSSLVAKLMVSHRDCLVLPYRWIDFKPTLDRVSEEHKLAVHELQLAVEDLDRRIARLHGPKDLSDAETSSWHNKLVRKFDQAYQDSDIDRLSELCLSIAASGNQLILFLLKWACSQFRTGQWRQYLAVRLLRRWYSVGMDVDHSILSFLRSVGPESGVIISDAYDIVGHLTRSRHFSVNKYLQWLIATGSLSTPSRASGMQDTHVRLLSEIPLDGLPDHVQNLRIALLASVDHQVSNDVERMTSLRSDIASTLHLGPPANAEHREGFGVSDLAELPASFRFALSGWLRHEVECMTPPPSPIDTRVEQPDGFQEDGNTIALFQFYEMRRILEELRDFPIFADILSLVSTSTNSVLLAAVADTLNHHSRIFAAIGALEPLFDRLVERHRVVRLKQPERTFLVALADLGRTVRCPARIVQQLRYDITRCEQRAAIAICSPVSDLMAENLAGGCLDADDEVDKVLSSGTSMDEQVMVRVFNVMVARLDEHFRESQVLACAVGSRFVKLRSFDEKVFDQLLLDWIGNCLTCNQPGLVRFAVPVLVSNECLGMSRLVDHMEATFITLRSENSGLAAVIATTALEMVLPKTSTNLYDEGTIYRYRLAQTKYCGEHQFKILRLVQTMFDDPKILASARQAGELDSLLEGDAFQAILKNAAVSVNGGLDVLLASSDGLFQNALCRLLDPDGRRSLQNADHASQISSIVLSADEINAEFCKARAKYLLTACPSDEKIQAALITALKNAVEQGRPIWAEFASLDRRISQTLCEFSETFIFTAANKFAKGCSEQRTGQMMPSLTENDQGAVPTRLEVIDYTASSLPREAHVQFLAAAFDRLKALGELLPTEMDLTTSGPVEAKAMLPRICRWIETFVHLAMVHGDLLRTTKNILPDVPGFLCVLCALISHPVLNHCTATSQLLFDVAAIFADDITDEQRLAVAKLDGSRQYGDPRIVSLFGPQSSTDTWPGLYVGHEPLNPSGCGTQPFLPFQALQPQHSNLASLPRTPVTAAQQVSTARSSSMQRIASSQSMAGIPPVPFHIRRWELLPDVGTNVNANDTALSLTLFGARRVWTAPGE
ncbi:hypothetical protein P152DRAFT_275107 [Eremomyces bilateralis CBS 781.70]|uniref:Mediator of RNA polymerase II transcription subunit 12 n=1 Tax=Eremomyces bilateralis CBS 781.70 TaxID=1392243 RepID=A0A6G1G8Z0_9PEZI|nr:uncharacterized protein P152DRAFT_275107 [Eremomyces bilateralis CBS 781.70]KAF1814483.1 hypothetical protein P152DRAFT_275107 [Eremomyces bilateralis CBS 781.70]